MTVSLTNLVAQQQDFNTSQNASWQETFPLVGVPSAGGVVPGISNIGNGSLVVQSVDRRTPYGTYIIQVTGISGGLTRLSVSLPDGSLLGRGVVGTAFWVAGLQLLVTQGSTPLAVNDSFAVAVAPQALDLTGLQFRLVAYRAPSPVSFALVGNSSDGSGTLVSGGANGLLSTQFKQSVMYGLRAGSYPYNVFAVDPANLNYPVVAFYGTINHSVIRQAA